MAALVLSGSPKKTLCFSNFADTPVIGFWSCLFVLSKVIELGEWQGFVSLMPSQLHPSSGPPYLSHYKESPFPTPWVLTTPLTQAPL